LTPRSATIRPTLPAYQSDYYWPDRRLVTREAFLVILERMQARDSLLAAEGVDGSLSCWIECTN